VGRHQNPGDAAAVPAIIAVPAINLLWPFQVRQAMERIKRALKKTFFAGLVVVVPIVITALALTWLFRVLDDFLSPVLYQMLGKKVAGLGILIEIILIFCIGLVATNVLGSRLLKFVQALLMRVPVVNNIYPTIRQVVEAFSPAKESAFKKVVLVEYPQKGIYSLGFLTSEVSINQPPENLQYFAVYIPTNNLYLGQVALFKAEGVMSTSFTVEEGLKIILSGGTAFPPVVKSQNIKSIP
jgi:uncharacterized membrane protein